MAQVITINWKGPEFQNLIENKVNDALLAAGEQIRGNIVQSISTKGTKTRDSKPGDPPFLQTNRLRGSIAVEQSGDVVRIGTNVEYARDLELGTIFIAKRPYLRPALDASGPIVKAALQRIAKI